MSLKTLINDFFQAVEAKDSAAVLAFFSEDGQFIDPHYPNVNMQGKAEILDGLTWAFKQMKRFGFTINQYYLSECGMKAAIEVATAHELINGKKLNFPQVFIVEVKNNEISRLQAYEPYGPHGIANLILKITRLVRKAKQIIS